MLGQDELVEALHNAVRAADPPCTRWCTYGIRIDGESLVVHHNGLGDRDSDWQTVYSDKVTALSKDTLAARLKGWIGGLHRGERIDLNSALAVESDDGYRPDYVRLIQERLIKPEYLVGERGQELIVTRGPAVAGWPWHVSPSVTAAPSVNVNTTWRWTDGTAP